MDEARTWLFPLYAEPVHPGVAAAARRRRSAADVEASTVLLHPEPDDRRRPAPSSPTTRWSAATSWAAAGCGSTTGQGRQAGLPRQLRDGGAGPQGAQGRPRRGALRRTARRAKRGHVVARQPAGPAAPCGAGGRHEPHLRPADPAEGRARRRRAAAPRPDAGRRSRSSSRSLVALDATGDDVAAGGPRRSSRDRCSSWLRSSRRSSRRSRSGCSSGRIRARRASRCGARSCGATSSRTPSSRCSPHRGSLAPAAGTPAAQRVAAHDGCADRARGVVRDLLAARGRPRRPSATARPSTGGASCRPTCSTTGSCRMDTVTLAGGRDARPAQRRSCLRRSSGRHATVGPGLARDARRGGAREDPLARQPDRPWPDDAPRATGPAGRVDEPSRTAPTATGA